MLMIRLFPRLFLPASILLTGLCASNSLFAAISDTHAEKNAQLNELNQRIEQMQQGLQQTQHKKDLLNEELAQTEIEIGKILRDLTVMKEALAVKEQEIIQLQQKTLLQKNKIEEQQHLLAGQLQTAYLLGKTGYVKLLLNQQDPRQLNRFLTYYGYINSARAELINAFTDLVNELADTKRELEARGQSLQSLIQQTQQHHQQLLPRQDYRLTIIKKLNEEAASSNEELQILLNNKNELEALIKRLRIPAFSAEPGQSFASMQKQLPQPTSGEISVSYGQKINYSAMTYSGIFIQAPSGEAVQAVYPGQVVFANWLKGYGLLIILDHGDGYMTLYAHNQSLYQEEGDIVSAGKIIAAVGNSGGNPEEGLYFEIRYDGKSINPLNWLS